MSSCDQAPVSLFRILVAALTIVAIRWPPSTSGNPITKRQFQKVVKLLEESIAKDLSGDNEYSDILFQEKYDKKNLTYYHAGNKQFPVFISHGMGHLDKDIHVLQRGEDYMNPKDQNDFVVLKKSSAQPGAYTVHQAHIVDMKKVLKNAKVIWNDGRVEQMKNIKPLLNQMGNSEVQARAVRAKRPLCDWIGYTLFCNTPKNVPPARERKEREPMDEEDDEPVKLYGVNEDEDGAPAAAPAAAKQKRYTEIGGSKESKKGEDKGKVGNELDEESEEEKPEKRKVRVVEKVTTSTTTTTKRTTTRPTTTTTTTTPPPPKVKVVEIVKEKEKHEDATEKNAETEEQVTKKKHKRKHKKKKNTENANKERR